MNMNDELLDRLAELDRQKAEVEAQLAKQNNRPEDENLAIWIHDKTCHQNHTDGCVWGYEKGFEGDTHKRYLAKAREILETTDAGTAIKVIAILQKW